MSSVNPCSRLPQSTITIHSAQFHQAKTRRKRKMSPQAVLRESATRRRKIRKKSKYVNWYEKLVSAVFLGTPIANNDDREDGQHSHLGEEQMKTIVAKGLERVEGFKDGVEKSNDVFKVITTMRTILDIPLQNIPQTTLPWAVISPSLDILMKPTKVAADLYNGVAYVVSRMDWYSKAVDRLLSNLDIKGDILFEKMHQALETKIVDLYQSMLFYQIKSVCFYYQNQLLVLLQKALNMDTSFFNQEEMKDLLMQIKMANETRGELE
ncbi:hypothetical protein BO71DRAFT_479868 [Aspergillus ellipticus CBS 707.79]|uniref:NWD NACHT-NTPase N-terminal domain-containing protein n=1 Tax=Aspergillus ellipticus CBS 707.79 TaxID=1448320 RepID=A0A319EDW0_9EURO|nr:hypothetical protein BO71DRAFT_479868 [Aspergillus ellipticus CBS 707.79]